MEMARCSIPIHVIPEVSISSMSPTTIWTWCPRDETKRAWSFPCRGWTTMTNTSARACCRCPAGPRSVRFASWGRFSDPVQTGKSQTVPALGAKLWDYYAQKPEEGAAFTQAMDGITSGIAEEVARVLDTSTTKLAIDVRG